VKGRRSVLRRLTASLTAGAAATAALLGVGQTAPATASALPFGRKTFVVSMMDGRIGALAVRLATYSFSADGTVTERYWAWRQDQIKGDGNTRWTKPSSGYVTAGCIHRCPVRTPYGFQKGASPHTYTGHWSMQSSSVLAIRWSPSHPPERWRLDAGQPGIVGAKLIPGGPNEIGWGVGSNAGANSGVSLAGIYGSSAGWITGPFAENVYNTSTLHSSIGWSRQDYALCASKRCMQSRKVTGSILANWYSSYFAGDPAVDGRKDYWNNQTGVVQQMENPGSVCISASGGGHTNALLQALDDNGRFVGFVGVEASINQRKWGQDIVAAYAMMRPEMLSAIGS
jgi:hypothetical protein